MDIIMIKKTSKNYIIAIISLFVVSSIYADGDLEHGIWRTDNKIELEVTRTIMIDEVSYQVGDKFGSRFLSSDFSELSTINPIDEFLELFRLGPYEGGVIDDIKIGWLPNNVVVYIESSDPRTVLTNGIQIGDSREVISEIFGLPYYESQNSMLYLNSENEMHGLYLVFSEDMELETVVIFVTT